ncbi:FUT10 fucosyltransferase, partial [Amia calva]|nr:FUT10 fucosyltransferase [Amia calva]
QVVVELGQSETKGQRPRVKGHRGPDVQQQALQENPLRTAGKELSSSAHQPPVIVWWSPLTGEMGRLGECGANQCFFTINKTYHHHPSTEAFLFYGTDFNIESLPLPRKPHHHWALFHEESPKNNYKLFHEATITLFNHTATFSRHSHLPLTTQYLPDLDALTSRDFVVPLSQKNSLRATLAPVVYVQSDCDPPSDRDSYVRELMRHIAVDSYGECLHNRDLPAHLKDPTSMEEHGFYRILARYKFILAFENAVCEDYITEKLWRPLKLGVVPVYYGSPTVGRWLPSDRSAIVVNPDEPPVKLARYLKRLDQNDREYEAYLEWKRRGVISNQKLVTEMRERPWGVQDVFQDNYIDAFECMVCNRVWENIERRRQGRAPRRWKAEADHLSCPGPRTFSVSAGPTRLSSLRAIWKPSFEQSKKEARALRRLVERNRNFTVEEFWRVVFNE